MTTQPAAREVLDLPLADLAAALLTGSHSVADMIAACLERIAQRNGPLNAVEAVLAEPALADAARLDASTRPSAPPCRCSVCPSPSSRRSTSRPRAPDSSASSPPAAA